MTTLTNQVEIAAPRDARSAAAYWVCRVACRAGRRLPARALDVLTLRRQWDSGIKPVLRGLQQRVEADNVVHTPE